PRWCLDGGHVFGANEREIERAWNRRGREGKDVDELEQLLEFFLVHHAEALLFVNYDEAEVFESNVAGNQTMCADYDVVPALSQQVEDFALFALRSEPAEHFHSHPLINP